MREIVFVAMLAMVFTACSQTAGGDLSTTTQINPQTNFQLNSESGSQGFQGVDSTDNERNTKE